jgi:hypothetical protein
MVDEVQEKRFVSLCYTASLKLYSVELKTTEFQTLVGHIYLFIYLFIYIYILNVCKIVYRLNANIKVHSVSDF